MEKMREDIDKLSTMPFSWYVVILDYPYSTVIHPFFLGGVRGREGGCK